MYFVHIVQLHTFTLEIILWALILTTLTDCKLIVYEKEWTCHHQ